MGKQEDIHIRTKSRTSVMKVKVRKQSKVT